MKKYLFLLLVLIVLASCISKLSEEQNMRLYKAYSERNYFKLDNLMSKIEIMDNNPDWLLYKSQLGYAFNKPEESIFYINRLLNNHPDHFMDIIIADLHFMLAHNAARVQDYSLAIEAGEAILKKHQNLYDSSFVGVLADDVNIWKTLLGFPKTEVRIDSENIIPIKRDIAGLMNFPVISYDDNDTLDFVFDTGASKSVIVKSLADKFGATILENKVHVYGFTGKRIESELGLVSFKLGDIEIKNSPFLIFPDSLLSFADGAYVIKGVIGFPVMNVLKQFTLKDDKELVIPEKPDKTKLRNLALEEAYPVVMVQYNNDTLPFHFDTGADRTILYYSFLNKFKDNFEDIKKTNYTIGGAGGTKEVDIFVLDSAMFYAGNTNSKLYNVVMLTEQIGIEQHFLYGNLGQDYIKNFSEMTINFESMNIRFK